MALYAVPYSLEAVIAESGILPSCIPRASRHTGGFGIEKPFEVNSKKLTIVMWIYLMEKNQSHENKLDQTKKNLSVNQSPNSLCREIVVK